MGRARAIQDKFCFYSTAEECADAAAPLYAQKRWRWKRCGIPDRQQILETLRYLARVAWGNGNGGHIQSGRLIYYKGSYGHERFDPFDRRTFDASDNASMDAATLRRLRSQGHSRRFWYTRRVDPWRRHGHNHMRCCCSLALEAIGKTGRERGVLLDLGCGDSADAAIAAEWGYDATGIDLFPPTDYEVRAEDLAPFARADVAERIPFPDDSVTAAICQAMVDLIEPEARPRFYAEVFRVLKPGGLFALNGISLAHGYGYLGSTEKALCIGAGFVPLNSFGPVFVFKKPDAVTASAAQNNAARTRP